MKAAVGTDVTEESPRLTVVVVPVEVRSLHLDELAVLHEGLEEGMPRQRVEFDERVLIRRVVLLALTSLAGGALPGGVGLPASLGETEPLVKYVLNLHGRVEVELASVSEE